MIKVGINGFGRIGRAVFKILGNKKDFHVSQINDIDPDVANLTYLLKYDTLYGRYNKNVKSKGENIIIDNLETSFMNYENVEDVPWDSDINLIVESSGVAKNIDGSRKLIKECKINKSIITHSPSNVDSTIIIGANENEYNPKTDNLVSSSICDATAIAPVLSFFQNNFNIIKCFFTTLHPWLGYQNLLDSTLRSVSSPGHYWSDYALGRNSTENLIPKNTTAAEAVLKVLPSLKGNLEALSFRIPTAIVSASDITLVLDEKIDIVNIKDLLKDYSKENYFIHYNEQSLVSSDYKQTEYSCIIDGQWIKVNDNIVKLILWYDNEWGYSNRVCDIVGLLSGN